MDAPEDTDTRGTRRRRGATERAKGLSNNERNTTKLPNDERSSRLPRTLGADPDQESQVNAYREKNVIAYQPSCLLWTYFAFSDGMLRPWVLRRLQPEA